MNLGLGLTVRIVCSNTSLKMDNVQHECYASNRIARLIPAYRLLLWWYQERNFSHEGREHWSKGGNTPEVMSLKLHAMASFHEMERKMSYTNLSVLNLYWVQRIMNSYNFESSNAYAIISGFFVTVREKCSVKQGDDNVVSQLIWCDMPFLLLWSPTSLNYVSRAKMPVYAAVQPPAFPPQILIQTPSRLTRLPSSWFEVLSSLQYNKLKFSRHKKVAIS